MTQTSAFTTLKFKDCTPEYLDRNINQVGVLPSPNLVAMPVSAIQKFRSH